MVEQWIFKYKGAPNLCFAGSTLLQEFAAIFPNDAVSAKLAVVFGISAYQTLCQAFLITVATFTFVLI